MRAAVLERDKTAPSVRKVAPATPAEGAQPGGEPTPGEWERRHRRELEVVDKACKGQLFLTETPAEVDVFLTDPTPAEVDLVLRMAERTAECDLERARRNGAEGVRAHSDNAKDRTEEHLPEVVKRVEQGDGEKVIADALKISLRNVSDLKRLARERGLLPPGRRRSR